MSLITKNKKAYFDYEVIDSFECGILLIGHEVKSIRAKQVNLKGSYIVFHGTEMYVKSMHISAWRSLSNRGTIDTDIEKKLLLHKKDILSLLKKSKIKGNSIIPLELYFKGSLIKMKIGLVKGKKAHQKKQILKERSMEKEAGIAMKKYI